MFRILAVVINLCIREIRNPSKPNVIGKLVRRFKRFAKDKTFWTILLYWKKKFFMLIQLFFRAKFITVSRSGKCVFF